MTAIAMMLLATMTTAELERAEGLVGGILGDVLFVKARSEDTRVAAFRAGYAKALEKVLRARFDEFEIEGRIDEVMERAGELFGPSVAGKLAPDIERHLKSAFRLGQQVGVVPDKVKTLWDKPRQEALDWLVKHDRFWIGKVFGDHLSGDFRETITAGLNEGLGRKDIGRRLRDMVMGKAGTPAKIEYYTRVAATTVNRARNWGGVFSLHAAGFTEYEIRSVLDERTSRICREMSGKTFRVRDAMDLVQRAMDSPPSAIETLAPWPRYDAERGDHYLTVDGSREYLTGKNTQWLAGHGLSLPPFHGNCRSTYVVTSAQVTEHGEVVEPAAPPFDVATLSPVTMHLDGMHEKKVFEDPDGNRWLFKPVGRGEEFRAWGDRAAAELAKKLGLPTPEVYVTEIGGKAGSLQKMFDVAGSFRGVAPGALSPDELVAIQREHAFDWLISNHDAHPGNMIRTKDGKLVGIDKGQLFRFFGKDRLAVGYNPNPEPSLYNDVFAAYAGGKDVALAPLAHGGMKGLLSGVDALSDDDFRRILSPYAKRAAEAGRLAYGTEEAFLRKALARRKSLHKDLNAFYRQLETKRRKALGRRASPRKAFTKVDAGFVRRVKAAGTHGQSLLVAGDDFENMNLLAYQVEGKGLFLEGKLRAGSQSKLLGRLGLNAGVAEPDAYWERILKVAKSVNHHLAPGGDGKVPAHTEGLWRELVGQLKGRRGGRERHYRKYLGSLASERKETVSWKRKGVGAVVEKYVAPGRALPKEFVHFAAKTTKGWGYKKQARGGRIRLAAGKRTFKGVAYDVDLGDGVTLHYIQHGDDNRFSKFGKVRIEVADETPAGVRRALGKMGGLGLDSRLATAEDLEQLYLSKVSYAAGVADKVKVTPGMTAAQRVKAYREFWRKKLGVVDVTKLEGYSPEPHFDNDKGWARWSRFDVNVEDFEQSLKDSALGHSLHEDIPKAIEAILESEGSLVATEEKFRIGVPISGMSPQRDQATGGASYVFTRVIPAGGVKRHDLVPAGVLVAGKEKLIFWGYPEFIALEREMEDRIAGMLGAGLTPDEVLDYFVERSNGVTVSVSRPVRIEARSLAEAAEKLLARSKHHA
jgi:hypothetical protein